MSQNAVCTLGALLFMFFTSSSANNEQKHANKGTVQLVHGTLHRHT